MEGNCPPVRCAGVSAVLAVIAAGARRPMIHLELFARFALISLIAFGGGQAALPLVERAAVRDTGWLTPATFGAAVAFGYLTPGPVLITATFVG